MIRFTQEEAKKILDTIIKIKMDTDIDGNRKHFVRNCQFKDVCDHTNYCDGCFEDELPRTIKCIDAYLETQKRLKENSGR